MTFSAHSWTVPLRPRGAYRSHSTHTTRSASTITHKGHPNESHIRCHSRGAHRPGEIKPEPSQEDRRASAARCALALPPGKQQLPIGVGTELGLLQTRKFLRVFSIFAFPGKALRLCRKNRKV